MNVYYHLTTKDLVNVFGVCHASKLSIQQKYDKLPITTNTVQEYMLYGPNIDEDDIILDEINTNNNSKKISQKQLSSTLKRSIRSIRLDIANIQLYKPDWFRHVKQIKVVYSNSKYNQEELKQKLNEYMYLSSATEVFWDTPLLYIDLFRVILPKGLIKLTIDINDKVHTDRYEHRLADRIADIITDQKLILKTNTNSNKLQFNERLSDLVIIGSTESGDWIGDYISSIILKPKLILNSLSIKGIGIRNNKSLKSITCNLLRITNLHVWWSWYDIIEWGLYRSNEVTPKRLIMNCRMHSQENTVHPESLLNLIDSRRTYNSPLEILNLFSYIVTSKRIFDAWITIITFIIQSNVFPNLKCITYEMLTNSNTETEVINFSYKATINGVELTATGRSLPDDKINCWLKNRYDSD